MSAFTADRAVSSFKPLAGPADEGGLSPRELVALFRRNWGLILISGLVVAIASYLGSKTLLMPRYTADGAVVLDMREYEIPEVQGVMGNRATPDPMTQVRSELQTLTSRTLVQAVVEELNITADPEFNATLRPPSPAVRIGRALRSVIPDAFAAALIRIGLLSPPDLGPASPDVVMSNVVTAVTNELGIVNDGHSLVIGINFTAQQPELTAKVVNSLIARYVAEKVDARGALNREANSDLERRADQAHDDLLQLDEKLREMREKYNLMKGGSVGQQQVEQLSTELTEAGSDRAQLEANLQRAAILVRTGGAGGSTSDALTSGIVGALTEQEAAAERKVAQLQSRLGPGHPQRIAAEAELASARGALVSEAKRVVAGLGAQLAAARQHEADVRDQLAKAQSAVMAVSGVQSELEQLEKDADARRNLYQMLLQKAAQSHATKAGPEQSGARVVSLALAPNFPSSPIPKLAGELGLISGFAFGGLLCAMGRGREGNYTNAANVTADTGLDVVAVLPRPKGRRNTLATLVASNPAGPEAEALRSLRNRLRLSARGVVPRSVLFIGTETGDRSAGMAAAFARIAALDGLRVLLIEGDLQTPKLAGILNVPPSAGMIETLNGHDHWPENLDHDNATSMDLLLVGRPQPTAGQLLETMQLQNLMAETREEYNLVVMDGQPVTEDSHSVTLAHIVDSVVLVAADGEAGRQQFRAAAIAVASASRGPAVVVLG